MKREYLDYKPLIKKEKVKEEKKDTSHLVTKDIFELVFGFEYPKIYPRYRYVETIKYPKTDGSNGKVSRFR